jgi:hypothetical protein
VTPDPLKQALEELKAEAQPELIPLLEALLAKETVEASWDIMVKEILDEA